MNNKDIFGETSLMVAVRNGHQEAVQVLLDHDADIGMKNSFNMTALDLARHHAIVCVLKKHKPKRRCLGTRLRERRNNIRGCGIV